MPSRKGRRGQVTGATCAVGHVTLQAAAAACTVGLSPWAVNPVVTLLFTPIQLFGGGLRELRLLRRGAGEGNNRRAIGLTVRMAVGSTILQYANLFGINMIGLGNAAALTAGALMLYKVEGLWSQRTTRWAKTQTAARLVCAVGICLLARPNWTSMTGTLLALVVAGCSLNHLACMNRLEEMQVARAALIASHVPKAIVLVIVAFCVEGTGWLTPEVLARGCVAGVLFGMAAHLQIAAIARLSPAVQGVLFTLNTPMAAVAGAIGVALDRLPDNQWPSPMQRTGIAVVFLAALLSAMAREPRDTTRARESRAGPE